ncbi:MAG: hypothetical protein LJE96_02990 [Deltaproteobacteria bacterium]|nr:hypothetical protein [Deltaproteobacteria bacterium]
MGHKNTGTEAFFETWMKSVTGFWDMTAKTWTGKSDAFETPFSHKGADRNRTQDSINSVLRMWQAATSMMNEPGAMDSFVEGMNASPEILLKVAQKGFEKSLQLQQQWIEKAGNIGKRTEAYSFENLDQDVFHAWSEIYEEEFRKFFNVPQLGLSRSYQERVGHLLDRFNLFQNAVAHFLSVLYLPMEKSFRVMQDEIEALTEGKKLPENSQEYYRMWIKILEGHYMTLFKSPEYTRVFNKALEAMEDFISARRDVLQDFIQSLPIPTQKEMDELYKEIYLLKKKVRQLEKKPQPKGLKT